MPSIPSSGSYKERLENFKILSTSSDSSEEDTIKAYDDNEYSDWLSDGYLANSWITFNL